MLVSIDTLRADHVGAYGASFARTSTLDAVAAGGARFAAAISPAPLTLVSHTTLLTGLDPPEHGVRNNGTFALEDGVPTLATALHDKGFATAAFVGAFVLDHRFGLARGFDTYDDRVGRPASGGNIRGFGERPADEVVDAALAWLEKAPDAFFLWLHLYDPHAEYRPPPGFAAAFPNRPYDGEIAFADYQVGRLLAAVDARWPDGRTLVVITADHGESLGEHGEPTHSHLVYEATQHVPLLVRGPGIEPATVVPDVVALRDVAPTVLDGLGQPPLPGATGRSLLPLLRGGRLPPRAAYVETLSVQFEWGWSPLLGLRTADRKYIRAPRPELYDLAADPGELHDLAAERPAEVAALDAQLTARLADARPVVPNLALNDDDRARLQALGYLAPAAAPAPAADTEWGRVGGPDPKDEIQNVARVSQADRLMVEQRFAEAVALLAPLDPHSLLIGVLASRAYLGVGDAARAEAAARAALDASPGNLVAVQQLVEVRLAQGRFDEARALLDQAGGESGELLELRARIERADGRPERAAKLLEQALAAPAPPPRATLELATLRLAAGRVEEAERLLRDSPPEASASFGAAALRLARALAAAGRLDEGIARARAVAEASPGDGEARLTLAELVGQAGDLDESRRLLESIVDGVERRAQAGEELAPSFQLLNARAAAALGRTRLARESLRRALAGEAGLPPESRAEARALAARLRVDRERH